MNKYKITNNQLLTIADEICMQHLTIELAARYYHVNARTLHNAMCKRLPKLSPAAYEYWRDIVSEHCKERSFNGILAKLDKQDIDYINKETGEIFMSVTDALIDSRHNDYYFTTLSKMRNYYNIIKK